MANIYPYLDQGRWDGYTAALEVRQQGETTIWQIQKNNTVVRTGTYAGRAEFVAYPPSPESWNGPNFFFDLIQYASGRSLLGLATGPLAGRSFKVQVYVRTPSSAPLGSDDLEISIGPMITDWGSPVGSPPLSPLTRTVITVADCKDAWVLLQYEVTIPVGQPANTNALTNLSIFAADIDSDEGDFPGTLGVSRVGELNPGGLLYIDDVTLEEIFECDLEFGTPAYNKTDETAQDENDGTITVNASSSFTRQYSLNNTTWQNSNVFEDLAPGIYTVYVRDTNGCNILVNNVTILEGEAEESQSSIPDPPITPAPMSVDMAQPLNKYNFITWFPADGDVAFNSLVLQNCKRMPRPNLYRRNKVYQKHMPIVAINEEFNFYFNRDYNYVNFSSLRLDLINRYGVVQSDVANLQRVILEDGTTYHIYATVELTALVPGEYRLAIVDTSDNYAILFVSNEIEVMTEDDAIDEGLQLKFRHSLPFYKYRYDLLDESYLQTIRLRLYDIDDQPDGTLEQYRAVSSGKMRNVSFELDNFIELESYYFDDLAHKAMYVFMANDSIFLNNERVVLKSIYKVDRDPGQNTNKGTIEFWLDEFSTANRYGEVDTITIIGSDDDLLLGDNGGFIKL